VPQPQKQEAIVGLVLQNREWNFLEKEDPNRLAQHELCTVVNQLLPQNDQLEEYQNFKNQLVLALT
jgi:non-homologous end joining protein Ku